MLVAQLVAAGIDAVFFVPGESFLPVLDALADTPQIRPVSARQEGGAAFMAAAYARATGRPGVCFVTRGPGVSNATVGVHTAAQDSTPLVVFVGGVPLDQVGRDAFQELDLGAFTHLAKHVESATRPERLPEITARALARAGAGRPGPVVVGVPEDVLAGPATAATVPATRVTAGPDPAALDGFANLLGSARRPLVLAGGPGWSQQVADELAIFASAWDLPVATAFRQQDAFDNTHPCYAGDAGVAMNPQLAERIRGADLLIALGARLDGITTAGYRVVAAPTPRQRLVHVHPDPDQLGTVFAADLAIPSAVDRFTTALRALRPDRPVVRNGWRSAAHEAYLAWSRAPTPGRDLIADVVGWLSSRLPPAAVLTHGAGNYTRWVHRFYRYRRWGSQLAPISGTMGYGVPAAIAAALADPRRPVVGFAGDGCFLMTGQELATAVQLSLQLVIFVVNNDRYGTIRMHQELAFPGRVVGTSLRNPDFAAYARAFGAHGDTVRRLDELPGALERAHASGGPAVIELPADPELLAPDTTISDIRRRAAQPAGSPDDRGSSTSPAIPR